MPKPTKSAGGYPLEPISRQRELLRIERARSVKEAMCILEQEEKYLVEAKATVARIEARILSARQGRHRRLRTGARASEIMTDIAHEAALGSNLGRACSRLSEAEARVREAATLMEKARVDLASAEADVRAVQRHRESWLEHQARAAEARSEEDP